MFFEMLKTSLLQVVSLVSVFLFCWTPYAVLSLAGIFGFSEVRTLSVRGISFSEISCYQVIPITLTVFPLQFAKSSIIWNPVIYVVMNPMVG